MSGDDWTPCYIDRWAPRVVKHLPHVVAARAGVFGAILDIPRHLADDIAESLIEGLAQFRVLCPPEDREGDGRRGEVAAHLRKLAHWVEFGDIDRRHVHVPPSHEFLKRERRGCLRVVR